MASDALNTGAPSRASAIDRRSLILALAATPAIASSTAAVAHGATPFRIAEARYRAAEKRLNGLPSGMEASDPLGWQREERMLLAACDEVDAAPCESWDEFADAFKIACDDGDSLPPDRLIMKLLADVRRLSGRL